jgi:plastocyanin
MLASRTVWSVVSAFLLTSCGGSSGGTGPASNNGPGPGPGPGPAPATVTVGNNNYAPDRVTVARGASVTWRWDSCTGDVYGGQTCTAHSVTFDDGGASAPSQNEGTFVRSFANAGTFTYFCSTHGRAVMSGSVVVQ